MEHSLNCHTGGNVIIRHNEIRDELGFMASMAFTPSSVRTEPLIHLGCATEGTEAGQAPTPPSESGYSSEGTLTIDTGDGLLITQLSESNDRGDLLISSLWVPQTDCVVDVKVTDSDTRAHRALSPIKVLAKQEKEKKYKYLQICLDQRLHFSPFVVSVDGMLGVEASAVVKRLARALESKWHMLLSQILSYARMKISMAILKASHHSLR